MPRKPLYYDSENGKKEVLGTSGSFEQVPDAPTSALPTEYPATYAAMQASITADPTTKRDFFVSADETNGGVETRYYYNGSTAKRLVYADQSYRQLLASNVQLSHTGDTAEYTAYTGTIPANSISKNGGLIINLLASAGANNANNKFIRVKFGATTVYQYTLSSATSFRGQSQIMNRNSLSSQVASPSFFTGLGISTANAIQTFSINTAADITVTVTIQNAVAGDTTSIESFSILAVQ